MLKWFPLPARTVIQGGKITIKNRNGVRRPAEGFRDGRQNEKHLQTSDYQSRFDLHQDQPL
jgi:hypothetical protein